MQIPAHNHNIPELQNDAIDVYIDRNHATDHTIPISPLNLIYKNTLDTSPLQTLLVDFMTFNVNLAES